MKPFLFSIGDTPVPSFFFFIVVGALVALFYIVWIGGKKTLRVDVILDMGIIGLIVGVLGSRVFHILVEAPLYYWEKPARVFEFWRGGFVSWGAFIAIPLSFLIYFHRRKVPVWPYLDLLVIGGPIIKFFIRLACLMAGCCYGKPTALPWAIRFTDPDSTANYFVGSVPLHPVQVYSMIHAILLFLFINWFYLKKKRFAGQTACLLAFGWTIPRALIEFLRADSDRGIYFGIISTGQVMALGTILLFAILYRSLSKKNAA
ncbi:MAG: prolipoprotein diacylglyceryl transferase [Deltaproteobacteria bacterium]|nr:prolipoprotein diacylglyceryl transferase [Deltaproteobacteria bacterium]